MWKSLEKAHIASHRNATTAREIPTRRSDVRRAEASREQTRRSERDRDEPRGIRGEEEEIQFQGD